MNKKTFNKLVKEAKEEFNKEGSERVKKHIKNLMREYEMAKATVAKIERQFENIKKDGLKDEQFLLEYDDE